MKFQRQSTLSPVHLLMATVALGLCYLAWAGYLGKPNLLGRIRDSGELVVVTRLGPSTYYETQYAGPRGLEYDLAQLFAQELGVSLRLIVASDPGQVFNALANRSAHVAAAGLNVTAEREARFRFTEPYMSSQQLLVYRAGNPRPRKLEDLVGGTLQVVAHSNHAEFLREAREAVPELTWTETSELSPDDLLYQVWSRQLDYTIADSNDLVLSQQFYPELRSAFALTEPQGIAWAMVRSDDDSLFQAAERFFERIRNDGTLSHLMEKYYGHLNNFDYVGTRTFMRHITERLPKYRELFEQAAEETGLDWRLLAAIGYQESHWNPRAVSPTGVRGIMMLTLNTAKSLGVSNRLDPKQSILGGARYLAQTKQRIPEHIPEPTRTWLALAAYNVGLGHLEDARMLTAAQGKNPDSWTDVKEHLPLLAKKEWYSKTRYGYARGWEPVRYVENVRLYYELLVRITEPGLLQETALGELAGNGETGWGFRLGKSLQSLY
ncbi:MAG: membrane-bound lytic murein transglycosylase MltF [Xanthomonadaceae bacterium]|nr:membrane-bound lytic murein transglycosylase MltF [Xanthomonadaceae bacterium]